MRTLFHATVIILGGSTPLHAQSSVHGATLAIDSVEVQRTGCLGPCPAYRMSVRADGFVWFVSHNSDDRGRVESHTRGPAIMRRIEGELERAQFQTLPEITMGRAPYCRRVASDAPTITVSVYRASSVRSLSYYTGCVGQFAQDTTARPLIRRLLVLVDSIDDIAAARSWIRPGRCCDD